MTGKDPLPIDRVNAFWRLDQAMRSLLERVLPVADRPVGFEHNLPTPLMQEPQLDEALNEMCVCARALIPALSTTAHPYTSLTSGSSNARLAVRAGRLTVGVREPVGRRETIRGLENLTFDLGPGALDALDRDVVGPSRFLAWNATGHIIPPRRVSSVRELRCCCRRAPRPPARCVCRRCQGVAKDTRERRAGRRALGRAAGMVGARATADASECPSVPSREEDEDFYEAFDAPRSPVYSDSSESDRDDASRRPRTPRHPSPLIQASSSEADKETGERNITVFTSPLSACPSESDIPVLPNEHPPTDNDVLSFELDPFWERELNGPRLDQQKEVEPGARGEEQDRQRCAERREEQGEHRDTNAMDNFAPVPELSQPSPAPSSSSDFIEWLPTFPDAPPSVPLLRSNVDPRSICPWHLPTSRHIPPVSPRGRGLRKLRRIALAQAKAAAGVHGRAGNPEIGEQEHGGVRALLVDKVGAAADGAGEEAAAGGESGAVARV
ncbi:uncharacterized protein COLE_07005 [Cutaneotrichosporon oleaginosum]|uniref:uncharacterized protein n=1 Tax=Cutaneotrichosporon oleaginosum TaxID=879819 RepID=UPI001329E17D|nr:hypothetical protein COLE_07005 [Cutaneotrichosporon oleaginosum]